MKLPNFRRIFRQDFEEQFQSLVDQLASTININFETLYQALDNRISLKENVFSSVVDVQVVVDASGKPTSQTAGKVDSFLTTIIGMSVISVTNLTNPNGYPTSGVTISFSPQSGGFLINNITGLIPGDKYQLKIVAFG